MPVSFSKSGITGSGNSSSQLMMLSSPDDESALETIAGEATAPSPSAADDFRNERRLTPAKSRLWVDLYMWCPPNAPGVKAEAQTDDVSRHRKIATADASAAASPAKLA